MLEVQAIKQAGHWQGPAHEAIALDYDHRCRRRLAMQTQSGLKFLLNLQQTTHLRQADALVLADGRLIEIIAAPEPLVELTVENAFALIQLAWHLGNRHLPTQITQTSLLIRRDHVIEAMARGLGAHVHYVEVPFDPENGAYAKAHRHGGHSHEHCHDDDHDHHHGHDHNHAHD